MVPFAGFEMPVQYTGVIEETKTVRRDAGLFDVSHMGQVSVRGPNALREVNKLVTNNVEKLALGQAQYNMLCNERGGVIDDLVVYRRSAEEVFICVNASNRRADVAWMKARLGGGVEFRDLSDETALLALQGPKAEAILCRISPPEKVRSLKYYWAVETTVFDRPCYLSRTGYTGEDGFELYLAAEDAAAVWERLLEIGRGDGLTAIGLGARDTLRLEMGYPLHGHELSEELTPLASGQTWVVKLEKEVGYVGQKALQAESASGPAKQLRAFVVDDRRIPRAGYRICLENKTPVGEITSGTLSPHLNHPIALGFVDKAHAGADKLYVEVRESLVPMRAVKLPFVPSHTKKTPKAV
jgi:aminomethyltransferase